MHKSGVLKIHKFSLALRSSGSSSRGQGRRGFDLFLYFALCGMMFSGAQKRFADFSLISFHFCRLRERAGSGRRVWPSPGLLRGIRETLIQLAPLVHKSTKCLLKRGINSNKKCATRLDPANSSGQVCLSERRAMPCRVVHQYAQNGV